MSPAVPHPPARRLATRLLAPLGLALLAACSSLPPRPWEPVPYREPQVDIVDYEIHLDLDHEAGWVAGTVAIEFEALPGDEPVRSFQLDAVGLDIHGAWDSQGRDLAVDVDESTIRVHLAAALPPGRSEIVSLDYDAFPRRGIHFAAPDGRGDARAWHVWTQGQAEETRHWMPVWDIPNDRATHTLSVTVDDALVTMAAGEKVDTIRDRRTGRRTDTWRMDTSHVSYLLTLVAGHLSQDDLGDGEVPLPVLAEADDLPRAMQNAARTADMLRVFGEITGVPYPYVKYSQAHVRDYTAGGMENISATTMYYEGIHDPADEPQIDTTGLIAHEAAHQWYGDLLTCRTWDHLWLNEGFADYLEALYTGEVHGVDAMRASLMGSQRAVTRAQRDGERAIVWGGWSDPDETFDDHAYAGGASRLHLLRSQLGDEAFLRGLRHYTATFREQVVETDDLIAAFEQVVDRDLDPFFDEWLYGRGFPRFECRVAAPAAGADPVLVVEQTQADVHDFRDVFHVSVPVAWSRGGVERREPMEFDGTTAQLRLTGQGRLDWVRFDADTVVPGEVLMDQTEAMWGAQLVSASDGVTRLLAAQWFAGEAFARWGAVTPPSAESLPLLLRAAATDPFVDVRVAAVTALSGVEDATVRDGLRSLAGDDDARVREAALDALAPTFGDDLIPLFTAAVEDANGSVAAAALDGLAQAGFPGAFRLLESTLGSTDKVRLARDCVQIAAGLDDERVLPLLVGAARSHPEPWVRAAALSELGAQEWRRPDVVFRTLCLGLSDLRWRVRAAAADALARHDDAQAVLHLRARHALEDEPMVMAALEDALEQLR